MRFLSVMSVAVAAASIAPACGGASVEGDGGGNVEGACAQWVDELAIRGLFVDELLAPRFARTTADVRGLPDRERSLVLAALRRSCVDVVGARGSNVTAAWLDDCRRAAVTRDRLDDAIPSVCIPPEGRLSDGEPCAGHHQCASLHCEGGPASTCGTCRRPTPFDAPCAASNETCAFDRLCVVVPGEASRCVLRTWRTHDFREAMLGAAPGTSVGAAPGTSPGGAAAGCAIGFVVTKGDLCPALVADGEPCMGRGITCGPRSACGQTCVPNATAMCR